MDIPLIDQEYVYKSLLNLDTHKSTGLDGISCKILKLSAPGIYIYISLTSIFNKSILTGTFPSR